MSYLTLDGAQQACKPVADFLSTQWESGCGDVSKAGSFIWNQFKETPARFQAGGNFLYSNAGSIARLSIFVLVIIGVGGAVLKCAGRMQEAAAPLFKRMSGHIITAKDALRAKCWSPKAPEPNPLQQLQLELASELAKNFSDPEVNGKLSQLQTDVQAPNADLGVIIEQLNEIKAKVELAKLHPLIEAAEKLVTADRAAQGAVQLVDGQQETFDVLKDQAGNMKKGDNETFVDFLARVKDLLDKITSLKNSLPAAPEESDE